ncbi:TfoX/Sxy family protein [Magnetospirillum sp. UT-4]|uniref:TfoX/Sxy family protein n=1 Tax=Magnetospirillum sp. UT-4 TaxID=2681467 RepID=UPI001380783E|nr:TfoX/Sxy family protein [Magnetospirillum sp. UT-4]CAA7626120.1 TfoX N-terminal domain superfamily [Magnetospirillum sp. UT-4]
MAASPEDQAAAELAREMFAPLGAISIRRMFGGGGIYCDGLFFALIADGDIYLKADAAFAARLTEEGSRQFTWTNPKTGKVTAMGYWRLPEAAVDDFDEAAALGREALRVARVAAAGKRGRG